MFSTNAVNAPVPMTAPALDGACPTAVAWFSANRTETAAAAVALLKTRFMAEYVTGTADLKACTPYALLTAKCLVSSGIISRTARRIHGSTPDATGRPDARARRRLAADGAR